MELCVLALGEGGDLVEWGSSMYTYVLPTLRGEFADAAEVLLVGVVELLCEPYVGAVDHEGIGRARHVVVVATATVSRAAGSGVAAEQDVHGGAVLDDVVEGSVALRCGVCATVWTLRHSASGTSALNCDRCGRWDAHAGPRCAGRDEPEGGDGLRERDGGNGKERERGNSNGLRGIGNVAEQVTIPIFTKPEFITESITCS
jgi:hypothetical protein